MQVDSTTTFHPLAGGGYKYFKVVTSSKFVADHNLLFLIENILIYAIVKENTLEVHNHDQQKNVGFA